VLRQIGSVFREFEENGVGIARLVNELELAPDVISLRIHIIRRIGRLARDAVESPDELDRSRVLGAHPAGGRGEQGTGVQ
jgi:hypothetical protein